MQQNEILSLIEKKYDIRVRKYTYHINLDNNLLEIEHSFENE